MIITPEQATLQAQERFDHLLDLVWQASRDGLQIDRVERDLMRYRLALGHDLLAAVGAQRGDGDLGRRSRPRAVMPQGVVRRGGPLAGGVYIAKARDFQLIWDYRCRPGLNRAGMSPAEVVHRDCPAGRLL